MPIPAEPFSFAKARGDGIYLLRCAETLTIIGRIGCLVFVPFWLVGWRAVLPPDLSRGPLVGSLIIIAFITAIIAIPVVVCLYLAIYVKRLIIDTENRRFTATEGLWPLLSSRSGNLEDIRFVRMSSHDRRFTRAHRSGNTNFRYMGFRASVFFHCSSFFHCSYFEIVHFEKAVPYEGASTSDFPWEVYSERLNEIRAFFEPLGVEVRDEIGGRKEDG